MKSKDSKGGRTSRTAQARNRTPDPKPTLPSQEQQLESLLQYLEQSRGFDFSSYKRPSLSRRILKRMAEINGGLKSYSDYTDYLEVHPEEFSNLFNTILINVTDFFRDLPAWEVLRDDIIPRLLENKRSGEAIRVWSAGCASGEEAYTIAMLFADAMGPLQFRDHVKIYGTDADNEALNQARQASYSPKQAEQVPPEYLERYFDRVNGRFVFNKDLRRSIIFGRHDLLQDAPISRVDLIVCRNTLMYFNAEAQARILSRFAFALNDGGYLFLGKAETLLTRLDAFTPADLKRRIFSKLPRKGTRDRLLLAAEALNGLAAPPAVEDIRLREVALDVDPVASLLIDIGGMLVLANEAARALFGLTPDDTGRPIQDLEISFRPVDIRSLIQQAYIDRHPTGMRDVKFETELTPTRYFDVSVLPLFDLAGNALGVKVMYSDISRYKHLQDQLQQSNQELETAYEELQSANEELETTNEELQSTVEELETTNEELQSTNEELETMNEELQSTNEELETSNEQLRQRSDEIHTLNNFNEVILTRMPTGMMVVDRDLQVTAWNRQAEDLWGLRAEEVQGQHLLNLDIGLPVDQLRQPIRAVLSGERDSEHVTIGATNRRGRNIQVDVTMTPLNMPGQPVDGAIIITEARKDGDSQG